MKLDDARTWSSYGDRGCLPAPVLVGHRFFGLGAYSPVGLGVGHDEARGRSAWKDCDEFAASPTGPPLGTGPRHPRPRASRGRDDARFEQPSKRRGAGHRRDRRATGFAARARSPARVGGRGRAGHRHRLVQLQGECVRCLGEVSDEVEVDVQELFVYPGSEATDEEAADWTVI